MFSVSTGTEYLINPTTGGSQAAIVAEAVASDDSGRFVAVWSGAGTGDGNGVFARLFDADGTALTGEILVNENTTGLQDEPSVAMDADGDFVVTWTDHDLLLPAIMARRFDVTGTAQGGEALIDANLLFMLGDSSVAMDDAGNFVVAWVSNSEDAILSDGVFAQRYSAAGVAQGAKFQVNATSAGNQQSPGTAMDADGDFVITFSGNGAGDGGGVFGQRYNTTGVAQGGEFLINTTTAGTQSGADVAMDDAGNFIVAWSGNGASDGGGVYYQRYNAAGAAQGGETSVNTTTAGTQDGAAVSMSGDGMFAIAWNGNGPGDADGVFVRQYDASAGTLIAETLVNTTTTNSQASAAVSHNDDIGFVVLWSGEGAGDTDGVFAQLFVNDPPSLDLNGASAGVDAFGSFTENGGAVSLVAADAALTDSDHTSLTGLTVTISNLLDGVSEVLSTDTTGTSITAIYTSVTGVLTLSGSDTVAHYQQVLRAVQYINNSENPTTTSRSITFVADDGVSTSTTATTTLTIAAVNDAPSVTMTGVDLAYTEGDGATAVDTGLTLSDADDANLTGATVSITGNFTASEDALGFTDQLGITGSYNALTGTLTLTGGATVADYQAALRTVTYANGGDDPDTSTRTVSISVTDGTDTSVVDTRDITIAAVNDAPSVTMTVADLSYTEGDGALAVDAGLTLGDVDNASLSGASVSITGNFTASEDALGFTDQLGITGSYNALTGTLALTGVAAVADYQAALRTVTYANGGDDPDTSTRTVSISVTDGTDTSVAATRDITVAAVEEIPDDEPTQGDIPIGFLVPEIFESNNDTGSVIETGLEDAVFSVIESVEPVTFESHPEGRGAEVSPVSVVNSYVKGAGDGTEGPVETQEKLVEPLASTEATPQADAQEAPGGPAVDEPDTTPGEAGRDALAFTARVPTRIEPDSLLDTARTISIRLPDGRTRLLDRAALESGAFVSSNVKVSTLRESPGDYVGGQSTVSYAATTVAVGTASSIYLAESVAAVVTAKKATAVSALIQKIDLVNLINGTTR